MLNKIINSIKDGSFFRKVNNKIRLVILSLERPFVEKNKKINNNKILFLTFQGNYNCNPKAIADEIIRRKLPYELVWAIRKENLDEEGEFPKEIKLVRRDSIKFYKEAASSKIIIDNANNFEYLKLNKKDGQILLQPWHGSMGFKKLDADSVKNDAWVKKAKMLEEITDYCITNSKFEENVFKESYWKNTPMLKYGHPRNDILFNKNGEFKKYSEKVKKMYGIDSKTKIALYAPTFRDNCSFESYNLDYDKLQKALVERFGGKWCIIVRFHFKLKYTKVPKKYLQKVINATDYYDMQELLCASDIGITDYSSWLCDYVLTGKPGFLFTLDIDKYVDERGFYYPLESSPFPVAKSNDELYEKIINFDNDAYDKNVKKFLNDRGCYERGNASERVADKIEEIINKSNLN